jgi:hypothetical protein
MDHDADMADSLTIAVAALQQAATGMVASGELRILGKVPEEASSAAAAMHDQHQELCQHISALQQCLLPCSSSIVSSIVAYLEHTTADRVLFIRLDESGELSKQCKGFAHALSSAQDGYEALGSELLGLQQTLDKTHKKVWRPLRLLFNQVTHNACIAGGHFTRSATCPWVQRMQQHAPADAWVESAGGPVTMQMEPCMSHSMLHESLSCIRDVALPCEAWWLGYCMP